jgi:hypothetical protein
MREPEILKSPALGAFQDPPTASMALAGAIRAALITNFRHKLACKEDLQTEAVVELFQRAWQKQQQTASLQDCV